MNGVSVAHSDLRVTLVQMGLPMLTSVFDPSQQKICERFPFVGFQSENLQKRHLWVKVNQNEKQTLTLCCAHLPT